MPLDLYLVRHGETAWTRTGQHTGRTDLPLLPEGERQARQLGDLLRGIEFGAAWSSDLGRAWHTAELAGFTAPSITPLLREFDYGEYEGRTSEEIWRERPDWQIYVDGCPGGESPAQVQARARAFLAEVEGVEGAAVAFSHGHLLRALATAWLDLDVTVAAGLALDTAALGVLHHGSRGRQIRHWNWTARLGPPGQR